MRVVLSERLIIPIENKIHREAALWATPFKKQTPLQLSDDIVQIWE